MIPKQGDRIEQEADGSVLVITPRSPDTAFNFGPASSRDAIVYTCERPGGEQENSKIKTNEAVSGWVKFMTAPERNIKHVVVLLGLDELEDYEEPGLRNAYEAAGLQAHFIPLASSPQSYSRIMKALKDIEGNGERVVAHCTHGMGRSGRVAAAWLVHKYGLSVEEASEEASDEKK